jgi:hypothetical protein
MKLEQEHLSALSIALYHLSMNNTFFGSGYTSLHAAVARQVKVKVDKKMASGIVAQNGYKIKLTAAELELMLDINRLQLLKNTVVFRNAVTRLIKMNTCL